MHEFSRRHVRFAGVAAILIPLCLAPGGCSPGIHWRGFTFEPVQAEARRDHQLTFVYFRSWAAPACTRFEETVLKDPAVRQAVADLYCVVLDFHLDHRLAQQCDVSAPPGIAIIGPDRHLLARLSGETSVDQVLAAIDAAKARFARSTQSAARP